MLNKWISLATALAISAPAWAGDDVQEMAGGVDAAAMKTVVSGNNAFGFRLLQEAHKAQKSLENSFVSPISAHFAFSMLANGAEGNTLAAILSGMQLTKTDRDSLNSVNSALLKQFNAKKTFALNIANSIWTNKGLELRDDYVADMKSLYHAMVKSLDFADKSTVKFINSWISDNTNGKITDAIKQIDPSLVLYLINAAYFKADWLVPFEKVSEVPMLMDFQTIRSGKKEKAKVAGMFIEGSYVTASGSDYDAIDIPYGVPAGEKPAAPNGVSMVVMVPKDNVSIESFIGNFDGAKWSGVMNGFKLPASKSSRLLLKMPKWKYKTKLDLVKPLKNLGMGIIFDGPDFSRLSKTSLEVSEAFQAAMVAVDEKGTEAAAVTIIGARETAVMPAPRTFSVDRPFVFAIVDHSTDTVLFTGTVVNPVVEKL